MFKLNYDDKNLDWNNPSIFDYRYIWYLARMVQQRSVGIGLVPAAFNLERYINIVRNRYFSTYLEYSKIYT